LINRDATNVHPANSIDWSSTVAQTATFSGLMLNTNATDATNLTEASVVLSGGLAVTKQLRVGGASTFSENVTIATGKSLDVGTISPSAALLSISKPIAIGATALVGTEKLRVAGGTAAIAGATDVTVGAGELRAGTAIRSPAYVWQQTGAVSGVAISSGSVAGGNASLMVIDTESAAATDDLDTITGGVDGQRIILRTFSSSRDVTVKHNTGNILLDGAADKTLDSVRDVIELVFFASYWHQMSFSNNA